MKPPVSPKDDANPVVLKEPRRTISPRLDQSFDLRPEETAPSVLHPGWAEVLAPGEEPLWLGQVSPDRRFGGAAFLRNPVAVVITVVAVLFIMLTSGLNPGLIPLLLLGLYLILRKRMRGANARTSPDGIYMLTNRAAYIARNSGHALRDIRAFPITSSFAPKLDRRSVTFATQPGINGRLEAVGFIEIDDAGHVFDLMRDIIRRQGQV